MSLTVAEVGTTGYAYNEKFYLLGQCKNEGNVYSFTEVEKVMWERT